MRVASFYTGYIISHTDIQGNERIQRRIGEMGGIDTLLQCVAMYKSRDPSTAEEEEFMQNCFDLLCSCLMIQENKAIFVKVCRTVWFIVGN
jgi:beta-catenin-like protein 1